MEKRIDINELHKIQYFVPDSKPLTLPNALKIFDLTGKTAIVTGATKGLGWEIAKGMAAAGAKVLLVARTEEDLRRRVEELSDFDVDYFAANVSSSEEVQAMTAHAMERWGKIDILVNDAGTTHLSSIVTFPPEQFDRVLAVNMRSCFLCMKYVGREMLKAGGGSIINIGSGSSVAAHQNSGAYITSKGGMLALTRTAALDWTERNLRVNLIMPSTFYTPLLQKCIDSDPDYLDKACAATPKKRLGEPEEIVGLALFLASDSASFVSGEAISISAAGMTSFMRA